MIHFPGRFSVTSPLPITSTAVWKLTSAAALVAAVLLCLGTFALKHLDSSPLGLLAAVALLGTMALLHLRFLSLAQHQSREMTGLVLTQERQSESIFEHALDAMLVLDDKGICQSANSAAGSLLAMHPERMIGQSVGQFFSDKETYDALWSELAIDGDYQGEAELVRADGATVVAGCSATREFLPHRYLLVLRDMSERRRAQEAVRDTLLVARSSWQQAEALRRASIALTKEPRMNNLLDALLETLAEFVPYQRAQLFLFETERRLFLAREAVSSTKAHSGSVFPETVDLAECPLFDRLFGLPGGLRIDDLADEGRESRCGTMPQARSWMGVPIVFSNQVLGILSLTASTAGEFSPSHLVLTRSLAALASVAIQQARLYERAEIFATELEKNVTELRQTERESPFSASAFEMLFRSVPVALSVSSIADGSILLSNPAFQRTFGLSEESSPGATDLELWGDPRERTKLIGRLGRKVRVRGAVARLRHRSGSYRETMYSAELIRHGGQACLLLAAEDQGDADA